jgi:hypothetical protein
MHCVRKGCYSSTVCDKLSLALISFRGRFVRY